MKILGTGLYVPGKALSNREVKELTGVEFDEEKIEHKLGIEFRHIAHLRGISETSADFAEKAARNAIDNAGLTPGEVDLFIVATDTPEYISPPTAVLVQGRLQGGQSETGAFDINGSCSGFVSAFTAASRIVESSPRPFKAVVIGMYNMPAYLRPGDSFGYSIFADGAGALVLSNENSGEGFIGSKFLADGTQWDFVGIYSGGTKNPVTSRLLDEGKYGLELRQNLPGNRNVELWPEMVNSLLMENGLNMDEVDHFLFTQINRSVIEKVMAVLKLPLEKTTFVMDRYGYTGSACIPMAFHHSISERRVKRGNRVAVIASGAGLAVSSALFQY